MACTYNNCARLDLGYSWENPNGFRIKRNISQNASNSTGFFGLGNAEASYSVELNHFVSIHSRMHEIALNPIPCEWKHRATMPCHKWLSQDPTWQGKNACVWRCVLVSLKSSRAIQKQHCSLSPWPFFSPIQGRKEPFTKPIDIQGHRNWEDIWTPKTHLKHRTSAGI